MKRLYCSCGQEVYFENTYCTVCSRSLGYDYARARMVTVDALPDGRWQDGIDGRYYQFCGNRLEYGVCNGIVDSDENQFFCLACRLNRTIPDISRPGNLQRWISIEQAKRRLVYGLLSLRLPLDAPVTGYPKGLKFDFLEDQRSNPEITEEFIGTGHHNGIITLNILEADEMQRVWQKEMSSERYRTILGHFRHEAGHYYYELLVQEYTRFTELFGDPSQSYDKALKNYYRHGPLAGWERQFISAYATSHPWEDWAETFAHYLHVQDALETAAARGVITTLPGQVSFDEQLRHWDLLAATLNELNRCLGLADAYPFVVTPGIVAKLHFVNDTIHDYRPADS